MTTLTPRRTSAVSASIALDRRRLRALLASYGQLFSEQLGIKLERLDPQELFRWFVASLLFGARIRGSAAVATFEELDRRGLLTPKALRDAELMEMLDVMACGGYSRYDGIATRKLQSAAARLIDEYGGDLNRLHESASDATDLTARLTEFWGVGGTTAGIFLRELRGLWSKASPPLSELAALAWSHLGIADPHEFWRAHPVKGYDFRHLEAALTRVGRDYCRRGRCAEAPVPHRSGR